MIPLLRSGGRLLAIPLLVLGTKNLSAQEMPTAATGAGAVFAVGSATVVAGTIGQPAIGPVVAAHQQVWQGFWIPLHTRQSSEASVERGTILSPLALQCTPNPVSKSATVYATLPANLPVALTLHDLLGREVMNLTEGKVEHANGRTAFNLDTKEIESGWYTLLLVSGEEQTTLPVYIVR